MKPATPRQNDLANLTQGFTAEYRTARDGGLTYRYRVTWIRRGERIGWAAKVTRDGELKGQPVGLIRDRGAHDPATAVSLVVEYFIENLLQVTR